MGDPVASIEQWLVPVLAFVAWPVVVIVVVLAALVLTRGNQRPAVLAGIADVIRAARGKEGTPVPQAASDLETAPTDVSVDDLVQR